MKWKQSHGVIKVVRRRDDFLRGICQKPLLASENIGSCELGKCLVNLWRVYFTEKALIERLRPDLLDVLLLEPGGSNFSAFGEKLN